MTKHLIRFFDTNVDIGRNKSKLCKTRIDFVKKRGCEKFQIFKKGAWLADQLEQRLPLLRSFETTLPSFPTKLPSSPSQSDVFS